MNRKKAEREVENKVKATAFFSANTENADAIRKFRRLCAKESK